MSREESEFTARVLRGEEKLTDKNGRLEMSAVMYLKTLAANADFEQEVRPLVGEHFDTLLQDRIRATVPLLLDMLKNRNVVHAISNYMYFIAVSCPARGISIEEFTSLEELRKLWHEAHLRSARNVVHPESSLHRRRGDLGVIASAVLAGIAPGEIGVPPPVADDAVDSYFGRNNPKMKDAWEAYKAEYDNMKKLFAV